MPHHIWPGHLSRLSAILYLLYIPHTLHVAQRRVQQSEHLGALTKICVAGIGDFGECL